MTDANDSLLCFGLQEISKETVEQLGERAYCLVDLYNDWFDIWGTFKTAYSEDLPLTSLVAADFFSLGKDLYWLHRLLHWGNYPLFTRTLRYNWELMFRAYYADVYQPSVPGDDNLPGNTLDDKIDWLETRGRDLHFKTLIVPILNSILPSERDHYTQLWRNLNQHVHPTKHLRYLMIEDSALTVRDGFDKEWADMSLGAACDVFDLIWLITLHRFPKCAQLLRGPRLFIRTKRSNAWLQTNH